MDCAVGGQREEDAEQHAVDVLVRDGAEHGAAVQVAELAMHGDFGGKLGHGFAAGFGLARGAGGEKIEACRCWQPGGQRVGGGWQAGEMQAGCAKPGNVGQHRGIVGQDFLDIAGGGVAGQQRFTPGGERAEQAGQEISGILAIQQDRTGGRGGEPCTHGRAMA